MSSGILRRPLAFWDVSRKQNTNQAEIVTTILRFRDTRAFGVRLGPSPRASFTTLCDLCDLLFRNFLGVFLSQSLPGRCALFERRRNLFHRRSQRSPRQSLRCNGGLREVLLWSSTLAGSRRPRL